VQENQRPAGAVDLVVYVEAVDLGVTHSWRSFARRGSVERSCRAERGYLGA
jgi:hypothetical protein